MRLNQQEEASAGEARYDASMIPKVAALASRLEQEHRETLSAREIETIGAEVGLNPEFMRAALEQLTRTDITAGRREAPLSKRPGAPASAVQSPTLERPDAGVGWYKRRELRRAQRRAEMEAVSRLDPLIPAWWAAGWAVPVSIPLLVATMHMPGEFIGLLMLPLWGVYVGVGTFLTASAKAKLARAAPLAPAATSRTALLELLFGLQRELEGQREHRAFLSVDVVGSSGMKEGASDLAVEYSFGNFTRWVQEVVASQRGIMQSAAGDGIMCAFADDAAAVRAARRLQEGIARFNAERNRLPAPFRIRCGIAAGEVAVDSGLSLGQLHSPVIDRAAALQKRAEPGGILLGASVAGPGAIELGNIVSLPEPVAGEAAFAWRSPVQ
jgi:class 3 adenylate cyclase